MQALCKFLSSQVLFRRLEQIWLVTLITANTKEKGVVRDTGTEGQPAASKPAQRAVW